MSKVKVKKKGQPFKNKVAYGLIRAIKVGRFIILPNNKWDLKTKPGAWLLRQRIGQEYLVQTLADDSGWKITRL